MSGSNVESDARLAIVYRDFRRTQKVSDSEYQSSRGTKVAQAVIDSGFMPKYYPILPGSKPTSTLSWREIIQNGLNSKKASSDIFVNDDHPFVISFLGEFGVDSFVDLKESDFITSRGLSIIEEGIVTTNDYLPEELNGLIGGVILPAVRVIFVPTTTPFV